MTHADRRAAEANVPLLSYGCLHGRPDALVGYRA